MSATHHTAHAGNALRRMGIDQFVTNFWTPPLPGIGLTDMVYASGEYRNNSADFLTLGMVLSPFRGEVALGSDKPIARSFSVGEFGLVPCSAPYLSRLREAASIRYVTLDTCLVKGALRDISPNFNLDFGRLFETGFRSPLISALVSSMFDDAHRIGDLASFRTSTLVDALVTELYRLAAPASATETGSAQRLGTAELRRIDEFLETTDRQVTTADLANLLGQSATRLSRSLKAVTGLTPYQYVLQRRVEKAQSLLACTERSLAQIAHDCGFSSQSHMTDAFRHKLGVTPGQVRRKSQ